MNHDIFNGFRCPLCSSAVYYFYLFRQRAYYRCVNCLSVIMHPRHRVDARREKERYEEHNNDVNDKGYRNFVMPVVKEVESFFEKEHKGLDFGAGTGPVISKLLSDKGYNIEKYDPFFFDDPAKLEDKYHYIVCCEVIEHFHYPFREFGLLRSLLHDNGMLFCKTFLYNDDTDFDYWFYKNDETHVFFYHEKAIKWICNNIGFSKFEIKGRLVNLQK